VQADVIVAHLFVPRRADIESAWVELYAVDKNGDGLAAAADWVALGEWKQLILDLRRQYGPNDKPLSESPVFVRIVYAVQVAAELESETVSVRLDDVAFYRSTGGLSIREQRGVGRKLFDFENWDRGDWHVSSSRVPTDTLQLVEDEQVYRGKAALKLDTFLNDGEKTSVSATRQGSPPQGGWIAQVYLPDDVPADTILWANLFAQTGSGWQGSATGNLKKGVWNTLVWDTRHVDWGSATDITIGIQIGAEDGQYEGPIYLDDIQIFE
jgi:hypothetical protein